MSKSKKQLREERRKRQEFHNNMVLLVLVVGFCVLVALVLTAKWFSKQW